jgi:hypothetical protein
MQNLKKGLEVGKINGDLTCAHSGNVGATLEKFMSMGSLFTACRDSLPAIYSTHCVNKAILCQRNNNVDHISEKALHVVTC